MSLKRDLAALDRAERALRNPSRSTAYSDQPAFGFVTPGGRLYCRSCASARGKAGGRAYELPTPRADLAPVYGPPHSQEPCDACGRPLDVVYHEAEGRAEQERGLRSVRLARNPVCKYAVGDRVHILGDPPGKAGVVQSAPRVWEIDPYTGPVQEVLVRWDDPSQHAMPEYWMPCRSLVRVKESVVSRRGRIGHRPRER